MEKHKEKSMGAECSSNFQNNLFGQLFDCKILSKFCKFLNHIIFFKAATYQAKHVQQCQNPLINIFPYFDVPNKYVSLVCQRYKHDLQ